MMSTNPFSEVVRANKLAPPNVAMTSAFHGGYNWRGIGEPERWAA